MPRRLPLIATLALAATTALAAPAAKAPPLVVFMAIDGLPMRQIEQWAPHFGADGFNRFLRQGRTYSQAYYRHGHTVTGAGHATMLTGAYPQRTGIISNEWIDPLTRQNVYCTEDRAHQYLDGGSTPPDAGTSPKNLLAETVGDVLRQGQPAAKVIGISGKDRGAILPAGHRGTAYMYRTENGRFTSSTYYMAAHPAWVNAFNARRPAEALWGAVWKPLLPDSAYAQSAPDDQPWMSIAGFGRALPATMGANQSEPGPRYYTDLLTSPFGDQLTLDFARAAIDHEQLGADAVPDLLSISLSAHDYVSHAFGPESRLAHDHLLHLDRLLGAFFRDLDAKVGPDRYVLVLTADHGFGDTAEWRRQQGLPGGRLSLSLVMSALNAHLQERFGLPKLATHSSAGGVLFDEAAIAKARLNPQTVYEAAATFLRGLEGIADANTRADLAGSAPPRGDQPYLAAHRLSWHPARSAPVVVTLAPGWIASTRPTGASHGTPHAYDQHVPILMWGPAWWGGSARINTPVQVTDIAPTLAAVLGLRAPAQAQGRVLPAPERPRRPQRLSQGASAPQSR